MFSKKPKNKKDMTLFNNHVVEPCATYHATTCPLSTFGIILAFH